jgi:ketosteroid isomerase-like protein
LARCAEKETGAVLHDRQKSIEEIQIAEKDFQKMTSERGITEAFWFYADSHAIIKRQNDTLIHGKDAIRKYYSEPFYAHASVTWSPDFIDASEHGDFGYTYGKYTWQVKDGTGKVTERKGIFHTVWKRQADGSWKYVWD